jgi:L-threonylcarbamoyladenylate synthase
LKLTDLEDAKAKLLSGDVVAIPTETVYGLGGWIYSDAGLKKIFSTKERPFFDPLIVHIDSMAKAKLLTSQWTEIHEALALAAWPGPLTLIAKKHSSVNPLITSGLDSVGLRCPRHEITLKLLSGIEGGVAAPSANKFGKTSPTTSKHVFEEFGESVSILEGGPSEVGIESTVVGIHKIDSQTVVEIYRPGFYTASMLEKILKDANLPVKVIYAASPVAPGQLKHHYMPKIPLVIVPDDFNWDKSHGLIEEKLGMTFKNPKLWTLSQNPTLASRELYENLRSFDQEGFDIILTSKKEYHHTEDWLGIWNRLDKAKTLSLEREEVRPKLSDDK